MEIQEMDMAANIVRNTLSNIVGMEAVITSSAKTLLTTLDSLEDWIEHLDKSFSSSETIEPMTGKRMTWRERLLMAHRELTEKYKPIANSDYNALMLQYVIDWEEGIEGMTDEEVSAQFYEECMVQWYGKRH